MLSRRMALICGLPWLVVNIVCLCDYSRPSIRAACPLLVEFMEADLALTLGVNVMESAPWRSTRLLPPVLASMFVARVYIVQASWYSDTCSNATSTYMPGQSPLGGHRVLEILGWIHIAGTSCVLLVSLLLIGLFYMLDEYGVL